MQLKRDTGRLSGRSSAKEPIWSRDPKLITQVCWNCVAQAFTAVSNMCVTGKKVMLFLCVVTFFVLDNAIVRIRPHRCNHQQRTVVEPDSSDEEGPPDTPVAVLNDLLDGKIKGAAAIDDWAVTDDVRGRASFVSVRLCCVCAFLAVYVGALTVRNVMSGATFLVGSQEENCLTKLFGGMDTMTHGADGEAVGLPLITKLTAKGLDFNVQTLRGNLVHIYVAEGTSNAAVLTNLLDSVTNGATATAGNVC